MVALEIDVQQYQTKPIHVTAVQWEPAMGAVHGVSIRPKKHPANPDDFYVRDRFGAESKVEPGDWVLTSSDGSHQIVKNGAFQALYDPIATMKVAAGTGETAKPRRKKGE